MVPLLLLLLLLNSLSDYDSATIESDFIFLVCFLKSFCISFFAGALLVKGLLFAVTGTKGLVRLP